MFHILLGSCNILSNSIHFQNSLIFCSLFATKTERLWSRVLFWAVAKLQAVIHNKVYPNLAIYQIWQQIHIIFGLWVCDVCRRWLVMWRLPGCNEEDLSGGRLLERILHELETLILLLIAHSWNFAGWNGGHSCKISPFKLREFCWASVAGVLSGTARIFQGH